MNTSQTVSPEFPIDENAIRIPYDKLKEFMEGEIFDEMIENLSLKAQEEELKNLN